MSIFQKIKGLFSKAPAKELPLSWNEHVALEAAKPVEQVVHPLTQVAVEPIAEVVATEAEQTASTEPATLSFKKPTGYVHPADLVVPEKFKYTNCEFMKFGYRDGDEEVTFNSRPGAYWKWFTEYLSLKDMNFIGELRTWREQNKIAASILLKEHGDAIALFYDGTLASQMMLLAFNDAGKIPRVYAVKFSDEENTQQALTQLYMNFSFPLRVIEMRAEDFWKTRGQEMYMWHGAISSVEAMKLWAKSAAGGVPVFSGGIPFVKKNGEEWQMADHEQMFLLDMHVRSTKTEVVPSFFRYIPEQLMSFLGEIPQRLNNQAVTDSFTEQFRLFSEIYPELVDEEQALRPHALAHEINCRKDVHPKINICWHTVTPVTL